MTKIFLVWSTSMNCRLVRRIRNASERGDCGEMSVSSGCLGASLSNRMPPRTGGVGDLGDVLRPLDAGVEQLADDGEADAEEQPEDDGQADVAHRLRGHRRCRQVGRVHDGRLDRCVLLARRCLELADEAGELDGRGLGDRPGHLGVRVDRRQVEDHGVGYDGGGDLLREVLGLHVQAQLRDDPGGELLPVHEVGVGADPLDGERPALERRGGGLVAGRDEQPCVGLVLRGAADRHE